MEREALEARWLNLTRDVLPNEAARRGDWPVRFDHCFQRILLDNAAGAVWYDVVTRRPAFRHAPASLLEAAIALGERVMTGEADLAALNRESLRLRGKLRA